MFVDNNVREQAKPKLHTSVTTKALTKQSASLNVTLNIQSGATRYQNHGMLCDKKDIAITTFFFTKQFLASSHPGYTVTNAFLSVWREIMLQPTTFRVSSDLLPK